MDQARRGTPLSRLLRRSLLLRIFSTAAILAIGFSLYTSAGQDWGVRLVQIVLMVMAAFPLYLWVRSGGLTLPIFAAYAFSFTWTYSIPLISGHEYVMRYATADLVAAAIKISLFLAVGTFSWLSVSRRTIGTPAFLIRSFHVGRGELFLSAGVLSHAIFMVSLRGGWFYIPAALFPTVRAVFGVLGSLGTFVLAWEWGAGLLPRSLRRVYVISFVLFVLASWTTLYLVDSMVMFGLAFAGYSFAKGRLPIPAIVATALLFSFLQAGKGEMRDVHTFTVQEEMVGPSQYPAFFSEWAGYSIHSGWGGNSSSSFAEGGSRGGLLDRTSLLHLFLLVQSSSPEPIPYMHGETYAMLPLMFVPRFLNPNRVGSNEGTSRLSVHYMVQTPDESQRTSIGWGLANEAYANFGTFGLLGLGLLLGAIFGYAELISCNAGGLTLQFLIGLLVFTFAVQVEYTAAVFVAALFQSGVVLIGISFLFMTRHRPGTTAPPLSGRRLSSPAVTS